METRNQGNVDDGDVSEPEIESQEEEEHVAISPEMRFFEISVGIFFKTKT